MTMSDDPIQILIPSMGRADTITSHVLFRESYVYVPESEADQYEERFKWMLENSASRRVFFCDDDIKYVQELYRITEEGKVTQKKITDPDHIMEILENSAHICAEIGAHFWSFDDNPNPAKYLSTLPFRLRKRGSTAYGGILKDGLTWGFDPRFATKADMDFYLMCLVKDRIIWADYRYVFVGDAYENRGGCTELRTIQREVEETKLLQQKYGTDIVRVKKDNPLKMTFGTGGAL